MSVTTYQQVADALTAVLKTIVAGSVYSRTLPPDHFYTNYDEKHLNKGEQNTYPKIFVTSGDANPKSQIQRRKLVTSEFWITVVVLQSNELDIDPQVQVRAIAEDIELALVNNESLGISANTTELLSVTFDAGFSHPEGIAILRVSVSYYKQY